MERLIPSLYGRAGMYKNKEQMFPSIYDGLLPVHRRYLLGLHKIARQQEKSTAMVVGGVIARWHPHADSTGPLMYLVQNGMADGSSGNWGSTIGTSRTNCAAMRYTKVKASNFIENIAFKYVDFVDWHAPEQMEDEPKYLPTMLPLCLVGRDDLCMMGFGFKTEIPCYKPTDLISRLKYLIGNSTTNVIIKPNVFQCDVVDGDYEDILTKGCGKISVIGKYEIKDKSKSVIVRGWSPRITFENLLKKINCYNDYSLLSKGDITWLDDSNKKRGTYVIFNVARKRNVDDVFNKMKEAVAESLKHTYSYNVYLVKDDSVVLAGIDSMLLESYNKYILAFDKYLHNVISECNRRIDELNKIEKLKPHISGISIKDTIKACKKLSALSGVNIDDVTQLISKYSIKKLLTISIDKDEFQNKISETESSIKNISDCIIADYDNLFNALA